MVNKNETWPIGGSRDVWGRIIAPIESALVPVDQDAIDKDTTKIRVMASKKPNNVADTAALLMDIIKLTNLD